MAVVCVLHYDAVYRLYRCPIYALVREAHGGSVQKPNR
jgi:hypothetical protein